MDGSSLNSASDGRVGENISAAAPRVCPACGARARRAEASFCATCGRTLAEDYFPTDSLRASYRFERGPSARKPKQSEVLRRERARGRALAARAHARAATLH